MRIIASHLLLLLSGHCVQICKLLIHIFLLFGMLSDDMQESIN